MTIVVLLLLLLAVVAYLVAMWWYGRNRVLKTTAKPAYTTDAMWWLWGELQKLEPSSALGGTFANKPGYHNYRNNLPSNDYSVVDAPDRGGPGNVCGAIDWTFYNAQRGDYSTISKYTKRLIDSGRDPNDHRLDGWRECYGQADNDSYVEGYDFRYNCDATSDSSHLWHIHLSENRDQAESYDNKQKLLSVLRGEDDDVTAKDVWDYDIDPSSGKYTAGGAQKVTMDRTGYLANEFAPDVMTALADLRTEMTDLKTASGVGASFKVLLAIVIISAILAAAALVYVIAAS